MDNSENPQNPEGAQTSPKVDDKESPHILKEFPGSKEKIKANVFMILGVLVFVIGGIATGWFLSGGKFSKENKNASQNSQVKSTKNETEEGTLDESVKYQEAEGMLVAGGIKGEGTYHIERDGGPTKYVYLTSTVISIDRFVGKKVKVWGETISGIYAPWLMDVAKIQIIN